MNRFLLRTLALVSTLFLTLAIGSLVGCQDLGNSAQTTTSATSTSDTSNSGTTTASVVSVATTSTSKPTPVATALADRVAQEPRLQKRIFRADGDEIRLIPAVGAC
jgi:uncharacterized lipoprotein YajG